MNIEKQNSRHNDVLYLNCEFATFGFIMILVYFATGNKERNCKIVSEVERILSENKDKPLILLGDMNAHLGFIGMQKINENGKLVIDIMEKYGLILLNGDFNCEGETTWSRGNQKSAIDFILVNEEMYKSYIEMKIDESKQVFDLSDHHLVSALFKIERKTINYNAEVKEIVYYKINEETSRSLVDVMERKIADAEDTTLETLEGFEDILRGSVEETMRRTLSRRVQDRNKENIEPIWFNKAIKKEISLRRNYNKKVRAASSDREKSKWWQQYITQKFKVQGMVKEAMTVYESKLTDEIKRDRNKNKKLWQHVEKLRDGSKKMRKAVSIYDEEGNELEKETISEKLKACWQNIYQRHQNEIPTIWNQERRNNYDLEMVEKRRSTVNRVQWREHQLMFEANLREHFDMVGTVSTQCQPMSTQTITREDVTNQLCKMKAGKAAGPDGLKPDMYRAIRTSNIVVEHLSRCLNGILNGEHQVPVSWKTSRTTLIPKKKRPTVDTFRPIAIMNTSYKIFMGITKQSIEEHLKKNGLLEEQQAGFTPRRRTTDNLFVLKYIIEETYKDKKPLFVLSVDFQKAFDSVRRSKLMELLMELNVDRNILDVVASVYTGDQTALYLNGEKQVDIEVSSGIRQGCNGSTVLFLIVTYIIITRLQHENIGFRNEKFNIGSLFYADDGLILARSLDDARRNIDVLTLVAEECGLTINRRKSKIIVFNCKEKYENIENMEVVDEIEYLGVTVTNKKRCFLPYKKKHIEVARKMTNNIYSVISRCCNRLMVGKTYWKGLAVPTFLYASEILDFTETDLGALQRIENQVYRGILQLPTYTAGCVLRSEIGASSCKARDIKNKLFFCETCLK